MSFKIKFDFAGNKIGMIRADRFPFGKYKNKSLEEVYLGWSNPTREFYNDFINYRLSGAKFSYRDEYKNDIVLVVAKFQILDDNKIKIEADYFLETTNEKYNKVSEDIVLRDLNYFFLYTGDSYTDRNAFGESNKTIIKINETRNKTYPVFSDYSYIAWCIERIEGFYILPSDLETLEKEEITRFSGTKLSPIDSNTYTYEPIVTRTHLKIDQHIKILNGQKSRLDKTS